VAEYIDVDWHGVEMLHDAYWPWNAALSQTPWAERGANIPEALTEAIVCLCTDAKLIRGGVGDILLPNRKVGEVKATSKPTGDLTSFSPTEEFDELYFVMANPQNNHIYTVYDLGMSRREVEKIRVSSTQTFKQQSDEGRRPRFSVPEDQLQELMLETNHHPQR
jgi:hypothetical protein